MIGPGPEMLLDFWADFVGGICFAERRTRTRSPVPTHHLRSAHRRPFTHTPRLCSSCPASAGVSRRRARRNSTTVRPASERVTTNVRWRPGTIGAPWAIWLEYPRPALLL